MSIYMNSPRPTHRDEKIWKQTLVINEFSVQDSHSYVTEIQQWRAPVALTPVTTSVWDPRIFESCLRTALRKLPPLKWLNLWWLPPFCVPSPFWVSQLDVASPIACILIRISNALGNVRGYIGCISATRTFERTDVPIRIQKALSKLAGS